MSEIQRYATLRFVKDGSVVMTPDHHGGYVRFTDHEAAIEQVLADATARIEGLKVKRTGGDGKYESIYNLAIEDVLRTLAQPTAINREGAQVSFVVTDEKHHHESVDALAALNQPQTGRLAPDVNTPAEFKEFAGGGGAAAAAGVADTDREAIEVHINGNPDMDPETAETLREAMRRAYRYMAENPSTATGQQGTTVPHQPDLEAEHWAGLIPVEGHREEGERPHVDPAIVERHTYNGGEVHVYPDGAVSIEGGLVWVGDLWSALNRSVEGATASPPLGVADADLEAAAMEISVKATRLDPETYKVPDKLIWMLRSALFPNEDMERIKSPGPYAKAFREKFPVPEFPGIKNRQEDQA